jgi:hypothetical protein
MIEDVVQFLICRSYSDISSFEFTNDFDDFLSADALKFSQEGKDPHLRREVDEILWNSCKCRWRDIL